MRILGLDYGSVTVGAAISDELGLTAQPLMTIRREQENKLRRTLAKIEEITAQYGVDRIVLGFPKNMDDSLGERCEKTLVFKQMLERRIGLPVVLWDERLTTWAADQDLEFLGIKKQDRKKVIDQAAAMYILQGYLDSIGSENGQDHIYR